MTDDLLQRGIAALKAGDKAEARRLFGRIIRQNPRDDQAWLWMSGAVDTAQECLTCLNKVLEINPHNEIAQRGLDALQKRLPDTPIASIETQPVPQPKPTLVQAVLGTDPPAAEQIPKPNPAGIAAYPYVKTSDMLDHSKSLDELDPEKRKALEGFVPLIARDLTVNHMRSEEIIDRIGARGFSRKAVEQIVREVARQPTRAPIRYERKLTKEQFESLPSPWLTMWTKPRKTIRRIIYYDPKKDVLLLAALDGLTISMNYALYLFLLVVILSNSYIQTPEIWVSTVNYLPSMSLSLLAIAIGICAIGGPIAGFVRLYLWGWLFNMVGRWLSGQAFPVEVRAAIAWATVPRLWGALSLIFKLILVGYVLCANAATTYVATYPLLISTGVLLLLDLVVGVWAGIARIKCLSEVHVFSYRRAVITVFLSNLMISMVSMLFWCLLYVSLIVFGAAISGPSGY
jgi:hypothetical protein